MSDFWNRRFLSGYGDIAMLIFGVVALIGLGIVFWRTL